MAASYPSTTKSFTTKTDGPGQTVFAAHVNDLQDEVVAIEAALRGTLAHALTPDGDVTRALGSNAARWLHPAGTVTAPGVAVSETDCGLYSSGANAIEIATNGVKALGIDSTQFIDSPTQPRAVAYHNTTQSLPDATETAVSLNSEDFDIATLHDTVTNNSRMTIPTGGDGLYWISGQVLFAANATGVRQASIRKNGTTNLSYFVVPTAGASVSTVVQVSALVSLVATDFIDLTAFQNSGGALNSGSVTRGLGNALSVVKLW